MNYYQAIKELYPDILDSQFKLQDDGNGIYISLWTYKEPQPNLPDLQSRAEYWHTYYLAIANRQINYPKIGDQLDALLKQFMDMQNNGITIGTELQIIIDKWQNVKQTYPID